MKTKSIACCVHVAALLLAGSSAYADPTWDLGSECASGCNTTYANDGNVATFLSDGITMTSTAWSTARSNTTSATTLAAGTLKNWGSSGWGIEGPGETDTTGPHSADNVSGVDMFELSFGAQAVSLSSVKIGWNGSDNASSPYTDSDISVLAYTGGATPTATPSSVAGKTVAQLLTSGWTLIGNYANVGQSSSPAVNTVAVNAANITSSWWLVSAYSNAFGSTSANGGALGEGNDAFKLLAVAGTATPPPPPGVPEPGTVALLGIGLIGMVANRRRGSKSAA